MDSLHCVNRCVSRDYLLIEIFNGIEHFTIYANMSELLNKKFVSEKSFEITSVKFSQLAA